MRSNVQQALQSRFFDVQPEGGLIHKLKSLSTSNFSNFTCKFLGRVGNRAVHVLLCLGCACTNY